MGGRGGGGRTLHDAKGDDEVLDSWVHGSTIELVSLQPKLVSQIRGSTEGLTDYSQGIRRE
jgi:hypothetical protein